ncbi:nucleotidyltransferase family protein [Amycolatopsis endophytica]|uniref:Mannose-1-phosphate guanylyltransferase n=1 Tax=Amycolatopsis endophytica TaxID=860233 RepID=A0A853AZ68_9PSEU|nr:nucleotidyltransferase family protein [Amycolatopsis endophytica]NYI87917.1 mannose-1-phosphate guanylyltransferase [Amycolatopsis endophytica]
MKAFLLAAGKGTRLRPLTDHTPKCLVDIGGQTMLDVWLDALEAAGVDEVLINLHHLAPLVWAHLAERRGGLLVHAVQEPELLGSAGTLWANRGFVDGEDMFLALNADNLTDFDLRILIEEHRAGGAIATLSVFHAPDPTRCGILTVSDGLITGFAEKPAEPPSDLANAGMYAFSPAVLDLVAPPARDIGYDLLPELVGRARAVPLGDSWFLDIGTPEALARARAEWQGRRAS